MTNSVNKLENEKNLLTIENIYRRHDFSSL